MYTCGTIFIGNFIAHIFNPLAWLLIGLIIYSFLQKKISIPLKIVLIALYGFYLAKQFFMSIFLGCMAAGAPGVPEYYGTLLLITIIGFLTAVGILLLYVLIKR